MSNRAMTKMKSKSHKDKVMSADTLAQRWLARWNSLEESGKSGTKAALEAERKAHYWLDRLNRLENM